jgi:hypothetical protein
MDNTFEELRIFRSMRVMTISAIHHPRFYLEVSTSKGCPLVVMAFSTQRLNGLDNEGIFS